MKKITMFMLPECPHCQKALRILDELTGQEKYKDVEITKIDERQNEELADQYDYYLVPTFYVDEEKIHEGRVEVEDVQRVLDAALD